MSVVRVLVVEDEPAIAELMRLNLQHAGYTVQLATDASAAQEAMEQALPDVIVLDWMLPQHSGVTLARRWRQDARTKEVPIIMVTARSSESDKVQGLDVGADDYLTKPFSMQELLARVRALLRRRAPSTAENVWQVGELMLDATTHRVTFRQQPLHLGPVEFRLLRYLMQYPERVHSRTQLLGRVWTDPGAIEERTVDVHVKRLREALGDAAFMLQTVRGEGYRLATE